MPKQNAIAIVGYGYRLPGGIRSDDDLWKLLSIRETVQVPITLHRFKFVT